MAVAGGIGSGKSVVCRILTAMGFAVYDCDSRAKRLMDESVAIKRAISVDIHPDAVKDGCIDRQVLAGIVFADKHKLQTLNNIVHAAVRDDIARWIAGHQSDEAVFVETAILYQSGLDRMVDEVWEVVAPVDVRVARVMARNSMSEADVRARIASQAFEPAQPHSRVRTINNDGRESLLLQLAALLANQTNR